MDDLISLSNESSNKNKLLSPLIPLPQETPESIKCSSYDNNPFDKILRGIENTENCFENSNKSNEIAVVNDSDNKENIGHLISPFQTPVKIKHKKLSNPIFLNDKNLNLTTPENSNTNDDSLQILTESFLNNETSLNTTNTDLKNNLLLPPLTQQPEDTVESIKFSILDKSPVNKVLQRVKNIKESLESPNKNNENTTVNDSFQLLTDSFMNNESFFSTTSNEANFINQLDEAFIKDNSDSFTNDCPKKCMSVRKPKKLENDFTVSKGTKFNNSFAGFELINKCKRTSNSESCDDDFLFLEATNVAEMFRSMKPIENYVDITKCVPPWSEEDIFFEDENVSINNKKDVNIKENIEKKINNNDFKTEVDEVVYKNENNIKSENNNKEENEEVKNAKDLLHNLSLILNTNGEEVDERKFGENLLNSLALALDLESPITEKVSIGNKKIQRSKSDSKVNQKFMNSLSTDRKPIVPKLKIHSIAPVKKEKHLKPKTDKDKVANKGPLKALIPLNMVAKTNLKTKISNDITPPRNSQTNPIHQIKKICTPKELKIKSPLAQSTPNCDTNNSTQTSTKRHFGFSLSPFSRPASTSDICNLNKSLNKTLSPKQTSGSTPNLSNNSNKSTSLKKYNSSTSIPSVKSNVSLTRRNSSAEITSKNTFNRSYENCKQEKKQLKRSSSFQSKYSTGTTETVVENKPVKKFGFPGKIKPLRIISSNKKI